MKLTAALVTLAGLLLHVSPSTASGGVDECQSTIAVANRGSGTVTVIDAESGDKIKTVQMPQPHGAKPPEPMYVSATKGYAYVGDRANGWVVVFNAAKNYEVVKLMPSGSGIFHQCEDQAGTILWVANDLDKTATVFDIHEGVWSPIKTVELEPECTGDNKPHDLKVTFDGKYAFISCIGSGYVLKYDAKTYEFLGKVETTSNDPHLGTTWRTNHLYVASQGSDTLEILDQTDLTSINSWDVPNAHGMTMFAAHDKYGYVTDINGEGGTEKAIHAFDLKTGEPLGDPVVVCNGKPDKCVGVAHNIASTGRKLFLTHTGGTSNYVSVYNIGGYADGDGSEYIASKPVFVKRVKVGLNPFGLDFVETTCPNADIL